MSQADYLVPTTELQAVNMMLEAISQVPVSSLAAEDTNTDAETALKRLYESNREVQSHGWHFNQDLGRIIDPSGTGEILLPANTTKVRRIYFSGLGGDRMDLVMRGNRLYDRLGNGFSIGCSVKVDITYILAFADIPEEWRWWVAVRAARRFATGKLHSGNSYQFTKLDEDEAMKAAKQADAETDQRTMFSNPHVWRMRRGY